MSIRTLPKELQAKAEKELNEVPSRVQEDLQSIREWLSKQPHLNARTDDRWLLNFLRGCKFSLERTKEKLDTFYSIRTLIPELFTNRNPFDPIIQDVLSRGVCVPIIDKSDVTKPVYSITLYRLNSEWYHVLDGMKVVFMIFDILLMEEDGFAINGLETLEDVISITLAHITQLTPNIIKKYLHCIQEAYPIRLKSINVINLPTYAEPLFQIVRNVLSKKLKNRMFIVGKNNMDELHKRIPLKLLPKEYGGENGTLPELIDYWKKKVESYSEWFLDDTKYRSDESKRLGKPKTSADIFGIEGSFRKLEVD